MTRRVVCWLLVWRVASSALAGPAPVAVLDGPEVQPLRAALKRIGQPFADMRGLNAQALASRRVLIVAGSKPPVDVAGAKIIRRFLNQGGNALGLGRGASALMERGLFDARGYYLTGTTIHMTVFAAYHRLTFGYPGPKPFDGWVNGVPNLLRATEGPLMVLGPRAVSILGYEGKGLYSAAAFQRVGKGLVLCIGPDPQGGKLVYALGKSKPAPGDKLGTDRLLANAVAFLLDPACNLIPNSSFEQLIQRSPRQSHWLGRARRGASIQWVRGGAPDGAVFARIACKGKSSYGEVAPFRPIAVEPARKYKLSCLFRASRRWRVELRLLEKPRRNPSPARTRRAAADASADWRRFETDLDMPGDASYVTPAFVLEGKGELCVDNVTLRLSAGSAKAGRRRKGE